MSEDMVRGQDWKEVNVLRPVRKREPGSQVYMTAAQAGATKIEQSLLDRTSDTVQALLAKNAPKSSKKSSIKLNLPWPRTGDKKEPKKDEPKKDEPEKGKPEKDKPEQKQG